MSYEGEMLVNLKMPPKEEVQQALLITLFKHNGVIREFALGEDIVDKIADIFGLNTQQRTAQLKTIYRKENRIKRSFLWHRLLFRAADELAKKFFICRPSQTLSLLGKKGWMLTEAGFDRALELLQIPAERKEAFPIKSYEVQSVVKKLIEMPRPDIYIPVNSKPSATLARTVSVRYRGFRQAVIEVYDYKCAICGLKIHSPDGMIWEVQAAHIVPHNLNGKDDILNGISLCHLHHWAFDVGWFSLQDDYTLLTSKAINDLNSEYGRMDSCDVIKKLASPNFKILLPQQQSFHPHVNAIRWHRENIFYKI